MDNTTNEKRLICFGEVLWDMLPGGKVLGGAPLNVALHTGNLGLASAIISKVGADDLGYELLLALKLLGINDTLMQCDKLQPSGTVKVTLDEVGQPSYDITYPVAWDFISLNEATINATRNSRFFLYETLAARDLVSRATLLELLAVANTKVMDANFRSPFYSQLAVEPLLLQADILKLSVEELHIIAGWYKPIGSQQEDAIYLKNKFNIGKLLLTAGEHGALMIDENNQLFNHHGFSVNVVDTVGCGDAFLAGFLYHFFTYDNPGEALEFAAAMGALMATRKGATSTISEKEVLHLIGIGKHIPQNPIF